MTPSTQEAQYCMTMLDQAQLRVGGILHELRWRHRRNRALVRPVEVAANAKLTFLCVSKRPDQLEHVASTWQAQSYGDVELLLVTNADGYGEQAHRKLDPIPNASVLVTDPSVSLGSALNLGIDAASGQVIAKIDDDDHYAPGYGDAVVAAMRETKAGVVGKKTYYAYLAQTDQIVRMFPGNEQRRVGRVAGGTIAFHRDVADHVRFADRTLGEDVTFVRAAERVGFGVHSTAAAGYVQVRSTAMDPTWSAPDEQLLASGEIVGDGFLPEYWQ
jgi:hypothetical protein